MASVVEVIFKGDASSAVRASSQTAAAMGRVNAAGASVGRVLWRAGLVGAAGIGFALKKAGDFEQELNTFQAVAEATGDQMKRVSALAKQLGADITLPSVSAADAAKAMTELAKGGLSVAQAMGAARGTLQLATAAQIDHAQAATVVARALNGFGLSGNEAGRVADVLANAANKSTGEITDFAQALQQSAAVARQTGLSIEETVAALAALADAGIVGSDAGTSLKTMLQRLIPVTKRQKDLTKELGIDVFNAQGRFVGIERAIGEYHGALQRLNPEQRQAALTILFGTDAVRAANILIGGGTKAYDAYTQAISRTGTAQRIAEARTRGFNGAWEAFTSTVETAAISLGSRLLPAATNAMRGITSAVQGAEPVLQGFITLLSTDIGQAALGASLAMLAFGVGVRKTVTAVQTLIAAIRVMNPYVIALTAVVGLLTFAYIRGRQETDAFADATEKAKGVLDSLAMAAEEAVHADLALASARANSRLAAIAVTDAEDALHAARQRGTPREINRAEAQLQAARAAARQAAQSVTDGENRLRVARQKQTEQARAAAGQVRKLTNEFETLRERFMSVARAGQHGFTSIDKVQRTASKKDVQRFAAGMNDVADRAATVAARLAKTNPALSRTAANASRAAATTAALAQSLGRIPTRKEVDIFIRVNRSYTTLETNRARGRQAGGPVRPNLPYLVGERGPELAVFGRAGRILSNRVTRRLAAAGGPSPVPALGSGGGVRVTIHFNGPVFGHNRRELSRDLAHLIAPELSRRIGVGVTG